MAFVVSARKYRPARFDEVVGQEHVSQTLKNALQNEHVAHAFLFCGPRGVGKTTCARILAKVLNCENPTSDMEACNVCSSCTSFNDNASFNIHELDAASNNSVEHIRTLTDQVRFQPQQGKYKVYIIDEVHMLSQAAFNAFLKTLEEPPPYAKFILATTEKHKIIPTILSRCQIFDFRRIRIPDMVEHLNKICATEELEAEADALHIIAQKADGALRDALSIFDRVVSSVSGKLTYADVISNLNILDYDYYFKLIDALMVEDLSGMMMMLEEILSKGFEPDIFLNGLSAHLRDLLVSKDERTLELIEAGDKLKERYKTQAALVPKAFLLSALAIANDCDVNYKMARNKRLHLEMAMIRMCYISRAYQVDQAQAVSSEKKNPLTTPPPQIKSTTEPKVDTIPPTEKKKPVEKTSEEESDSKKEVAPVEPEKQPVKQEPAKLAGSLLSKKLGLGSLSKIEAEIEAEELEEEDLEEIELTQEYLEEVWNGYLENIQSPSGKSYFKSASVKLEGEKIRVMVGSKMAENTIKGEKALIPYLEKKLRMSPIQIEFSISREKQLEKPVVKKPLTDKEKYLKLREQNGLIDELQKRFELMPDKD